MIRSLRRRFILIAMLSLLGTLAVAVKLREEKRADDPTRRIRKRKVAH